MYLDEIYPVIAENGGTILARGDSVPKPGPAFYWISLEWSGEPGEAKRFGGLRTPKQYAIVVSDIDDLITDVLKTSSWNPGVFMETNQAALEAIIPFPYQYDLAM
jgi:hypothetical protein